MGSKLSKSFTSKHSSSDTSTTNPSGNGSGSSSSASGSSSSSGSSNSVANADVKLYLAACELDPDVKTFDSKLQQHATSALSMLSLADDGIGNSSLSFDSLRQVTGCLMDMNQEVARIIIECKKDVWKSKELLALVEDYFEYSIHTLDFFTSLDHCLKKARGRQFIIEATLRCFEDELNGVGIGGDGCDKFAKTLQELRSFKEAGDPFGQEFFSLFSLVRNQQVQMLGRLQRRKRKLDKKLKSVKVYRKVSNIIFVATFVAVVICSVVAAAVAAGPVASAIAAAASAPVGGMGKWVNSLWKKYERELKDERALISTLELGTYITVKDLDNIRVLVEKLEIQIEALMTNAGFALTDVDTLPLVIDEIRNKLSVFMEGIDTLLDHSDKYSREIRQARTVILHRIIKYPSAPA